MTGWEFLHLVLNILTASAILILLVFIGKFFCVSVLENIYDKWDYETGLWVSIMWSINVVLLIMAWFGYVYDIEPLAIMPAALGVIFWLMYMGAVVVVTLKENIFPFFNDLHHSIKKRKQK